MRTKPWKQISRIQIIQWMALGILTLATILGPSTSQAVVDDTDLVVWASAGERKNGKVTCILSTLDGKLYGEITIFDDFRFKLISEDGMINGHIYDGVMVIQDIIGEGYDHAPGADPNNFYNVFAYEVGLDETSQWKTTGAYRGLTGFMTRCAYLVDEAGRLIKCVGGFYVFRFGNQA